MSGDTSEALKGLVLTDVTPLSLGIKVQGDIMSVVVPRNRKLPVRESGYYYTIYDQQTSIYIGV